MPILVPCPSCGGQLRVADDLVGRKVRCPGCATTFNAAPAPAAPGPAEKIDAWKHLNLELSDDPKPPPPPPRPPAAPAPPRRAGPDEEDLPVAPLDRGGRRGGRRDDEDDEDEDRPRRRRRERRDADPHRGGFVLAMGIVSLVLLVFVCTAPLSIAPGLVAWICGAGDLRRMREGEMDDNDGSATQAGWVCGIIGTVLGAVILLGCGSFYGIVFYEEMQRSNRANNPRFNAPPPNQPF